MAKKQGLQEETESSDKKVSILKSIFNIVVGIIALKFGGDFVVNSASNIATSLGVSEKVVSLTIVAFSTSLPELITFFESQKHYKTHNIDDILGVVEATNNLLTSNILNLFIIQSLGIIIFSIMSH